MDTVFTQEESYSLQSKLWWVACNQTPFLMRIAIFEKVLLLRTSSYNIEITDLRTVWVTRQTEK